MSTDIVKKFAERLVATRRAFSFVTGRPDLSSGAFARELGVAPHTYRRYERAEIQPSIEFFQALRTLTGISMDYLICDAPNGIENPTDFTSPCEATFGQRLQFAREIGAASLEGAAAVMGASADLWRKWESGAEPMPPEKMNDFCHRFYVSLDYLLRGLPTGIASPVLAQLLLNHPELWRRADSCTETQPDSTTAPSSAPPKEPDSREPTPRWWTRAALWRA